MLRPWAGRSSTLLGILRAGAAWQASAPPIDVMSLGPTETGRRLRRGRASFTLVFLEREGWRSSSPAGEPSGGDGNVSGKKKQARAP